MLTLRKADNRFHTQIDWLDSRHSFSFGEHYDPRHMGFGPLRVINDDRILGGGGFPTHPHRDMEIITVVLKGALSHRDSLGNGSTISPGEVQKMSAGTGIRHSEFNSSPTEDVRLLQIWIVPAKEGIAPEYHQIRFAPEMWRDRFCLVAAPAGTKDVIPLNQDARLYITDISAGKSLSHALPKGRDAWVQVAEGSVEVNETLMQEGDGLAVADEASLAFTAKTPSKVLLFELSA